MFLDTGDTVKNYTVSRLNSKNWDFAFYEVTDGLTSRGLRACEFFPSKISKREGGVITPLENERENYDKLQSRFRELADNLRLMALPEFIRIKDMAAENNTTYVFYEAPSGEKLLSYMAQKGGKLNYREAIDILAPLMRSLCRAFKSGVYFRPEIENIRLGANTALDDFYIYEYRTDFLIEDMANIFFTALTGKRYKDCLDRPSNNGAILPPGLDNIIYEALYLNVAYNSADDFLNTVVNSVAAEPEPSPGPAPQGPIQPPEQGPSTFQGPPPNMTPPPGYNRPYGPPPQKSGNKLFLGCLGGGCLLIVLIVAAGFVLFGVAGTRIARMVAPNVATQSLYVSPPMPYVTKEHSVAIRDGGEYFISDTYAHTHFEETELAYNGFLVSDEDYIYYRRSINGVNNLVRQKKGALGEDEVLLKETSPAFMQIDGGNLYYTDAQRDNHIYYIDLQDPHTPVLVVPVRSAFLQAKDGVIYYTNLEDGRRIYRIEENGDSAPVTPPGSEYAALSGDYLYFMSDSPTGLFRADTNATGETGAEIVAGGILPVNIQSAGDMVYYIEYMTDTLYSMGRDNAIRDFSELGQVNYFQVLGDIIYYLDSEYYIRAYDTATGENTETGIEAVYFTATDDGIYYYEYYEELLYYVDFDQWENIPLFD